MRALVQPPPESSPKPVAPPPAEPAPELVAHFASPATRKRLLGNLRWHGVPERRVEDVLHETLRDMWKQRHAWPGTVEELDRVLNTALRFDRIDDHRNEARSPLLRKDTSAKVADDQGADADDDDPPAMIATTTETEPTLQARDGLRFAVEYAESRPRLRKSLVWLMQNQMGMSYADIAAKEHCEPKVIENALVRLRAELRMVHGPLVILAGFVLIYVLLRAMHGYVNDQATDPNVPKPTPNIVAPPAPPPAPAPTTAPQLTADDLRTRAFAECHDGKWAECYDDLEAAKQQDPAGDRSARVKAARAQANRGMSGKPPL
jgi:DNA-directed RNA polymerase specialized sigma24 family protein